MFNAKVWTTFAGLIAAAQASRMPSCYVGPYAAALNTTTCGPLDVGCVCQSNTYLNALQGNIPQVCDIADQSPVFSYIMAACSDFGVQVTLSTTSVPLTTSTIPTTTVTSIVRVTGTESAATTGVADGVTSDCPKQGLSTGASIGLIIAAFALGGLLFAAGAVLILRRRQARLVPERIPDMPHTPYTEYGSQTSTMHERPMQIAEAGSKRPRVEMMEAEDTGSHGRPAELS